MKIARFFAYVFACLGVLLLIGSFGLCMFSLNAPVRILEMPQEAVECSDAFAQALNSGDLAAAAQRIYGQPDLGVAEVPADAESAAVWNAFLNSVSFEFTGKCYADGPGLARDGSITTLDIASVTEKLPERAQALMNQRVASAETLEELYDAENHFRQELVEQILRDALQQALTQDAETITREVTVNLIFRDGTWWVVPDQALLQAISGVA